MSNELILPSTRQGEEKMNNFNRRDFFGSVAGSLAFLVPMISHDNHQLQKTVNTDSHSCDFIIHKKGDQTIAKSSYEDKVIISDQNSSKVINHIVEIVKEKKGGEIRLGTGVYEIDSPIHLPSLVSLRGRGRNTILKLSPLNQEGIILKVSQGESIVISDLTCQGIPGGKDSNGIVIEDSGDCEIRNVHSRDFDGCGLMLRGNSFMNKIINLTTSANKRAGILIKEGGRGRGGDWMPNLILGCTSIAEQGHGMELDFAICTNITGCQIFQPKGHGFYIHSESNSTCISGSRVYQGHQNGIMVENSHELNVSSNIICWNRKNGIELNHVVWGTVSANEFIDNGARVEPKANGIYLHTDTKSVQITANAIFNWHGHLPMCHGIYEAENCENYQITHNTINYLTEQGVVSQGKNSIAGNNLVVEKFYPHPGAKPFPDDAPDFVGEPFNSERIEAFLKLTRR